MGKKLVENSGQIVGVSQGGLSRYFSFTVLCRLGSKQLSLDGGLFCQPPLDGKHLCLQAHCYVFKLWSLTSLTSSKMRFGPSFIN